MTQPSNTYATNDMVGIREDLSDVIYDVSPVETPFLSMAAQIKATNTYHEWQVDALGAASATNFVIEGDTATTDAGVATVRRGNYTAISDKVADVSGTARAVTTAGRADELDYQMLKRAKELKRDMEKILLANNARVAGNDTTARECAGVPAWIISAVDNAGDGTEPTGDGTDAYVAGTARQFTEDMVKTAAKTCWDNGGNPDVLLVGSFSRQIASTFGGGTKMQKAEDKTLHATFDIYEGDFSTLKIVPDRFTQTDHAFGLEMEYWKVAFLPGRNMVTTALAKVGDTDQKQILSEYTLEACNEKASFVVRDLTTS